MDSLHLNLPAEKYSYRKIAFLFLFIAASLVGLTEMFQFKIMVPWRLDDYTWAVVGGKVLLALIFFVLVGEYCRKYFSRPNEEYKALFESNPNPMWIYDTETLFFLSVNRGAVQHYGFSKEEFLSFTIKDIRPSEDIPRLLQGVRDVQNGFKRTGVWRHKKKNGSVFFVEVSGFKIKYNGRPAELVVAQDVTKQIDAEINLEISNRNITALMNNTNDLIWSTDKDLKIVFFNKAFFNSIKSIYNHEFAVGDDIFFHALPENKKSKWQSFYRRVLGGEQFTVEDEGVNEKDEKYFLEVGFNPILDAKGQIIGTSCFVHNITKRRRIEYKVRDINRQYAILCKATNDAIWDWYLPSDSISWNHGVKTIFGYEERDASYNASWWSDNLHPDDYRRVWEEIRSTFRNKKQNWTSTYRFKCYDGQYKYVFDRAYVLYEQEKPVRMIGAIQDIDERLRAVDEIKKLSLVASKTENSVIITNRLGKIEWVNEAFSKLTGYLPEEVLGMHPAEFLHGPNTDPAVADRIRETLHKKNSVSEEILIYSKQRKEVWIRLSITPVLDESGDIYQHVSIQGDITKHKEFEQHIIAMANDLSNLIENANAIIFGVDQYGRVNEWNNICAKITRFERKEALGKRLSDILKVPKNCHLLSQLVDEALEGKSVANYEIPILTKDRESKIILLNATPRMNPSGQIIGVLAVGQDITELTEYRATLEQKVQERTRDLVQALAKEKEVVEMRNKFVSMVSHEFKSPMACIDRAVDFMKKNKTGRVGFDEKLDSIQKHVNHMSLLLNDVLTIGKYSMDILRAENSFINLYDFLENLIREVELSTGQTHLIEFDYRLPQSEIFADRKLLQNIFVNLLINGIKFSPEEKKLFVSVNGYSDKVYCEVRDFGIGISETDQRKIFEPFHRGDNAESIEGTGLGLSIVKKAVDILKGNISIESKLGVGTVVRVVLPA